MHDVTCKHAHACLHTHTHALHVYVHSYLHVHIPCVKCTHTHTCTYMRTHTRARIHAHTCTYTPPLFSFLRQGQVMNPDLLTPDPALFPSSYRAHGEATAKRKQRRLPVRAGDNIPRTAHAQPEPGCQAARPVFTKATLLTPASAQVIGLHSLRLRAGTPMAFDKPRQEKKETEWPPQWTLAAPCFRVPGLQWPCPGPSSVTPQPHSTCPPGSLLFSSPTHYPSASFT